MIGILWLIVVVALYLTLPTLIIQSRLDHADVTLRSASMTIDADTSATLKPEVAIFASKELLQLPMISYHATIPPFEASVLVDKSVTSETSLEGSSKSSQPVELGIFKSGAPLTIDSSKDVNLKVTGKFTITGKDFMGDVVNHFIKSPTMAAQMKATMSITAKVWGWLPIYLPAVSVHYTDIIPAMDNFKKKDVTLDEILTAEGLPGALTIGCSAFVNNPSPAALIVNDQVRMQVAYEMLGQNYTIGVVSAPSFIVNPGDNVVNGTLVVEQTLDNEEAIVEMITAYMGGLQHGFDPSATKPFQVSIKDDGVNTAHSEMLRNALNGLDLTLKFRPQPLTFLRSITGDVSFLDKSKDKWFPSMYTAKVNLLVFNPLPQKASVLGVRLKAYQDDLESGKLLYNFDRTFTQEKYIVPAQKETWVSFDLNFFQEVSLPSSWGDIKDLAKQIPHREITVGVNAEITMLLHPSYEQKIRYTNEKVSGYMCFHIGHPTSLCTAGSQEQRPPSSFEAGRALQVV